MTDDHMDKRHHFDDILNYILNETSDESLATKIVDSLKSGEFGGLQSLLNEKDFLDQCEEESPSAYFNEYWRKRAHIQVIIKQRELYFEFIFSKTPDCLKIVTAYPNRRKKRNFIYHSIDC